ncbi:signal recognition particle-docking protein FtsY, partial (plasmid) [Chromobacterium amazonense]|uniref:signal recognition particle receptor subunit alpha n=1 Tax=Chromobacterium amazonense TaxID=1382803 RepID=UPI002A4ED606|nr:signal recognition particle-docking protein FtsY [Chromobacterium amazonense]
MFSFFKKKPKPVETPQIETPALPTAAIEDVAPAIPQPVAETPAPSVAAPALIETVAPAAEAATISAQPQPAEETAPLKKMSWTERLKAGLSKTRDKLGKQLAGLFGGGKIDEELYEDLETVLLTAD